MQEKASKDLQHNTLTIERTTHHYTLGKLNADTKCIWLVCHGYGQTADRFIKNFETLPEGHFVIAPEAYNYFYWHSPGREPVASWMTRRHRKFEIQDYLAYLQTVCDAYQGACPPQSQWIFFGFSQGCATISRFAFMANPDCKRLILWGGDFPRDIDYTESRTRDVSVIHVLGDEDEFIDQERYTLEKAFATEMGLDVEWISYAGKHRVDRDILQDVAAKIAP